MAKVINCRYELRQPDNLFGANHRCTSETPEPAPSLSGHGVQIGVFCRSCNQNDRGLLGVYVTWIYCSPSVKTNMQKAARHTKDCENSCFQFVLACDRSAKTRRPQIELYG